jgi:hypothetical protein
MPHRLCPYCQTEGRLLPAASNEEIDLYRCDNCLAVWIHHKENPDGAAEIVAPPASSWSDD